ncbi:hypothetical protein NKR19_g7881 [Coniochaeta hoffmannii]|uniref:Uncharacterized protein n=1 Tax=Coniochaeta hoffmannii TaxID=91930 RepID=A0AA38RQE0_9PEZI|nr:hypothetical protein NKR19_g7881 [Coniochaeta hoffmannii]
MHFKTFATVVALFITASTALPNEVLAREPTEAYCCGLGKRGELVTKCCPRDVTKRDAATVNDDTFKELYCCGLGRRGELNTRCC